MGHPIADGIQIFYPAKNITCSPRKYCSPPARRLTGHHVVVMTPNHAERRPRDGLTVELGGRLRNRDLGMYPMAKMIPRFRVAKSIREEILPGSHSRISIQKTREILPASCPSTPSVVDFHRFEVNCVSRRIMCSRKNSGCADYIQTL